MSHPEVSDEVQLAQLEPLTRILVRVEGAEFKFIVTHPRNAGVYWRPERLHCKLGTRPYRERPEAIVDGNSELAAEITWGVLAPGRELLMRRPGSFSTICVGRPIESIVDIGHGTQYQPEAPGPMPLVTDDEASRTPPDEVVAAE